MFYFQLSEIIRRYLKNRFHIFALEKVSEDLKKDISECYEISDETKIFLNSFLEITDFFKYTDANSSAALAKDLFTKSRDFVIQTKKIPESEEKKK